jgi:hypothetical protein
MEIPLFVSVIIGHPISPHEPCSVGSFDDAAAFTLSGEIYIDHKPSGYTLAGDHPRLTEAEFLAKFQAPA